MSIVQVQLADRTGRPSLQPVVDAHRVEVVDYASYTQTYCKAESGTRRPPRTASDRSCTSDSGFSPSPRTPFALRTTASAHSLLSTSPRTQQWSPALGIERPAQGSPRVPQGLNSSESRLSSKQYDRGGLIFLSQAVSIIWAVLEPPPNSLYLAPELGLYPRGSGAARQCADLP